MWNEQMYPQNRGDYYMNSTVPANPVAATNQNVSPAASAESNTSEPRPEQFESVPLVNEDTRRIMSILSSSDTFHQSILSLHELVPKMANCDGLLEPFEKDMSDPEESTFESITAFVENMPKMGYDYSKVDDDTIEMIVNAVIDCKFINHSYFPVAFPIMLANWATSNFTEQTIILLRLHIRYIPPESMLYRTYLEILLFQRRWIFYENEWIRVNFEVKFSSDASLNEFEVDMFDTTTKRMIRVKKTLKPELFQKCVRPQAEFPLQALFNILKAATATAITVAKVSDRF